VAARIALATVSLVAGLGCLGAGVTLRRLA